MGAALLTAAVAAPVMVWRSPSVRATGPTITATPATNITDGEFIQLQMSGFAANQALSVAQCMPHAGQSVPTTFSTDCTPYNRLAGIQGTVQLDGTGSGSAFMPIYVGADPLLANNAGTASLTCDNTHPCFVAADQSFGTDPSLLQAVFVPIAFAPSPDLCPPVTTGRAVGSGSAAATWAMYGWQAAVCVPPQSLPIQYSALSSPSGVNSFLDGSSQYALTGPWAPSEAPVASGSPPQTWGFAPLTLSGLVIAFFIFDESTHTQLTHLTLTPDMVAQAITGANNGQSWAQDTAVQALNPGVQFPPAGVAALVRAEASADTWQLTSWLSAAAPTSWTTGGAEILPTGLPVQPVTGSEALGISLINQGEVTATTKGYIGYMDSSMAAHLGLPTVSIKRADGSVTQETNATITQAMADATTNADGTITPDYATADPNAWPIPTPTSMMAPTNNVTTGNAATLQSFIRYAAGTGQTNLPAGYAPLTPAMVTQATTVASELPVGSSSPEPTPSGFGGLGSSTGDNGLGNTSSNLSSNTFGSNGATKAGTGASSPAAKPGSKPTATPGAALATSAALPLATDAFGAVVPAILGIAIGGVVAGVIVELVSRRRGGSRGSG